jgi:hypothetical protein
VLEGPGNPTFEFAVSVVAGAPKGDELAVVLELNPFEGALLNISNALAAFAVLPATAVSLGAIGLGVKTC